jgi:glycosyltransferase involved in cell wall biosynthesis
LNSSEQKKDKILILFSYFYPYSDYDNYINSEIEILSENFSKIYLIPINLEGQIMRTIPHNSILINHPFEIENISFKDKLKAFFSLTLFWELYNTFIKRKKKFSVISLKIITVSFLKINHYKKKLLEIINNENNSTKKDIYIYSYWMLENAVASGLVKRMHPNVRAFSRAHSLDIYFERHSINYIPFSDKIYVLLDAVYFISEMGRNYFIKAHNIANPSKLHVSRLGTNRANAIPEYLPQEVLRIISLSWILPLKRIELIIDSLQKISTIKIHWVHIGAYYPDKFESLKKYAGNKLSLNKNITYELKGDMKNDEISNYLSKEFFDVFISASATEGIPVSMMEAMSFGIPVISTNVGGVHEIVEDSYNGFLLDANPTAGSIAQKITAFYNLDKTAKQILRKNAIYTWDTKYHAIKNYENFVQEFCQL